MGPVAWAGAGRYCRDRMRADPRAQRAQASNGGGREVRPKSPVFTASETLAAIAKSCGVAISGDFAPLMYAHQRPCAPAADQIDTERRTGQSCLLMAHDHEKSRSRYAKDSSYAKDSGYAKDRGGNLVLIGTMPLPHSKDKPSPSARRDRRHLIRQGATMFKKSRFNRKRISMSDAASGGLIEALDPRGSIRGAAYVVPLLSVATRSRNFGLRLRRGPHQIVNSH